MSHIALGTYRFSDLNPQHIQTIKEAVRSGITLIDTSSNYMDGGSERAIAIAFRDLTKEEKSSVEIVSKFGYIQNSNMLLHKEEAFEDVVEYSEECYHSISPQFLKIQLHLSLKHLEMKKIECYLIHNPEYFLLDAINKGIDRDEMLDEMYSRIYRAFVALEEEVKSNKIASYGISSNSFSKKETDIEFLPYEDLLILAKKASETVGNKTHHFTTIELPINLLEREGLKCAKWAKENGLRVLSNRPLNAKQTDLMFRLADYDESREYYHHFNELLDVSRKNSDLVTLVTLLEQLDDNKHKFGWLGDYDAFLYSQIIPHIKNSLEKLDENDREIMLNFIDLFLQEYRKMVAYECSKNTRVVLKDLLVDCKHSLQSCAVEFLHKSGYIDFILVGMRKSSYLHDILTIEA
jgi:aryl-alcohol dehydrogenase-like predicted oxidoreductase